MQRNAFIDARCLKRGMEGTIELSRRQRIDGNLSGKQPTTRKHLVVLAPVPPPRPQSNEQRRREHGIAITFALAPFDPDQHTLAVDIGDLQVDDFARA